MDGVIFGLFALSFILYYGMCHYILASNRPGIYPPKTLLKKRAKALAAGGTIVLLLAAFIYYLR
ncbi:hypothetical protein [Mesobacillus harenae]|uniref:hypothetical protein n=1 Tax=Mesobacillus harenae TaxID=2213203 RepID=UPI001580A48C|nr:hypothetical protein [Mesobacillus harenae]